MDLNFKCLGKNIGLMIVEILRPFEFGMTTHSDGTAHGSRFQKQGRDFLKSQNGIDYKFIFDHDFEIIFFCHLKTNTFTSYF